MLSSLGQRIAHYRKLAGLTQKALAESVGVSPTMLSYYEKDKRDPGTPTLVKLAEVLSITGDKLLGLAEARPSPAVYKNRIEFSLLREIRLLNGFGQDRALEYISQLKDMPKYSAKKQHSKTCPDTEKQD
ncbi:MAG: helix-turn-helix transcriptional regulator [Chitinispirillia bacterium]|nr:helix-turn-helix transcriptional regulator [Chitinispirillia bacterium]